VGCAYNISHQFTAQIPGVHNVLGPVCSAAPVDKIPDPQCKLEVTRRGTTSQCDYKLSAESVLGTISSYNFDGGSNKLSWDGSQVIQGIFNCNQNTDNTFQAHLWGMGGKPQTGTCSASVPKIGDKPSAPRNLKSIEVGKGFVKIGWQPPQSNGGLSITAYTIEVSSNAGSSWSLFAEVPGTENQNIINNLTDGIRYSFRVAAKNILGQGAYSPTIHETPFGPPPWPPLNLAAIPREGKVGLTWSAPQNTGGSPIIDYTIIFGRVAGANWDSRPIYSYYNDGVSTNTWAEVQGLEPGALYEFKVAARNSFQSFENPNGLGAFSPAVRATPLSPLPVTPDRIVLGERLSGNQFLESENKQFKLFFQNGKMFIIQNRLPRNKKYPISRNTTGIELVLETYTSKGKIYDRFLVLNSRGRVQRQVTWIHQGPSCVRLDNDGRLRAYLVGREKALKTAF
jgi:hypothetical protein